MIEKKRIEELLDRTGIPYRYFLCREDEAVPPPFMVWYLPGTNNFAADGAVYHRIDRLNIELYTDQKDVELEERLERELEAEGMFWNKTEAYLEDEELYEILYEMEV